MTNLAASLRYVFNEGILTFAPLLFVSNATVRVLTDGQACFDGHSLSVYMSVFILGGIVSSSIVWWLMRIKLHRGFKEAGGD